MQGAIVAILVILIVQSILFTGLIYEISKTIRELEKDVDQDNNQDV